MKPTLLIHGGAGTILRKKFTQEKVDLYLNALREIVESGQSRLLAGESAVDVVAYTVSLLENNPLFNAGNGSVLTEAETIEMDACIMDGRDKSAGAVTCVSHFKNPIFVAKLIMQNSPHVCFAREGAEKFAEKHDIRLIDSSALIVPERYEQLKKMRKANKIVLDHDGDTLASEDSTSDNPIDENNKYGTVGAVALDQHGNLASATSTGGMTNKAIGRVGDTPIVGAGCYADDVVAVSCTGIGEAFMRGVVAHDISARMRYGGEDLCTACDNSIQITLSEVNGEGGVIAVDKNGNIALPMNSDGMYRAQAIGNGKAVAKIFCDEQ